MTTTQPTDSLSDRQRRLLAATRDYLDKHTAPTNLLAPPCGAAPDGVRAFPRPRSCVRRPGRGGS